MSVRGVADRAVCFAKRARRSDLGHFSPYTGVVSYVRT
jgi:hypothetical protein